MKNNRNPELAAAEKGISDCDNFDECNQASNCLLELSSIQPNDDRRGHRDPRVLLVTEAPDKESSQGSAYEGSISGRIQSIFRREDYGIGLSDNSDSFVEFLQSNRFYATSAVKCYIGESTITSISRKVISNCHEMYLRNQIHSMANLELVIPMGKVAAESLLSANLSDRKLTTVIGTQNVGIIHESRSEFDAAIIAFPHPSGVSPLSNPPIIKRSEPRHLQRGKEKFQSALREVRQVLDELGYDVLNQDPDSWEGPEGLSKWC